MGYLERFKEEMSGVPLVYEFRNRMWMKEQTFQFLERNGIGFCIVDEPKLPKLMPYLPKATSEIGYFRLHGRNTNWFNVPMKVRYDYLYTEEELKRVHSGYSGHFTKDIQDPRLFQQLLFRLRSQKRRPDGQAAASES